MAVGVVVAGLLGAAGWFVLPGLFGGAAVPEATENEPTAAAATAGEATEPVAETETAVPKPAAPVLPDRPIAEWLQEAQDAMAEERYDEAVLAFHAVLKTAPGNTTAREQARVAGDLYKEQQEMLARWQEARGHFETGRYEQAMKIFYRLPEGTTRSCSGALGSTAGTTWDSSRCRVAIACGRASISARRTRFVRTTR